MKQSLKWIKWALAGAIGIFVALQFFNPPTENPPVKADFIAAAKPSAAVAADIRVACYDCHSDETRWPWYSRIAPVSWLIASDVIEGREHLNLSEWPAAPARAAKKLDLMNEEVDYREMPPRKYTLIHADARLSDAQRKEILDWTDAAADKLRGATNN
jgi:Haem-binding domain